MTVKDESNLVFVNANPLKVLAIIVRAVKLIKGVFGFLSIRCTKIRDKLEE